MSTLTDHDIYLFREGTHAQLYDKLGCQLEADGLARTSRCGRPTRARCRSSATSTAGTPRRTRSNRAGTARASGKRAYPASSKGAAYKYRVVSQSIRAQDKGDPFAFYWEEPPRTASRVWQLDYEWGDARVDARRARARNALDAPMSIYEVHLGSWRRDADGEFLGYRAIAEPLVEHVKKMGFTHVELMPITEHPFYGSWGYQTTGYFAPTARYGTPQDFMYLVDTLHQNGIGVILDWVPSHFPNDEHGLYRFDGTHLYEHADPRQGFHPDWNSASSTTAATKCARSSSRARSSGSTSITSTACASTRSPRCSISTTARKAGRVDPEPVRRPREPRRDPLPAHAERSGLPRASRRADDRRGIDRLADGVAPDLPRRPRLRPEVEHGLDARHAATTSTRTRSTAATTTASSPSRSSTPSNENFVLPLSHDEVVHGKGSLIGKMPGDDWQQFANLRLLYGYMWAHPGKKLLFMGGEFGQRREWQHEESLEWWVLQYPEHGGLMHWIADLNRVYRARARAARGRFRAAGFRMDRRE